MGKHYLSNPFTVGKYISKEYFCDREQECEIIEKQIRNGRNIALISPRRMGKTGLIMHFFDNSTIHESFNTIYIDIFATTSFNEFVYMFGKSIFEQLKPENNAWFEKFFKIISSFRIGFKLDAISGEPTLDLGLGDIKAPQTTLDEIFEYLEKSEKPCIVAIDEFQQIGSYPEKNLEALLRTKIQQCKKTQFIFAGSRRHIMNNMFNSPAKPFYQSAISIGLDPILENIYCNFARGLFKKYGKELEEETFNRVYHMFDGCTWFVQMMMNEMFALCTNNETCKTDKIQTAWENLIQIQSQAYEEILSNMAQKQKNLLQAIAKESTVKNPTSSGFIQRHNLISASSVQSSLRALVKNDIVVKTEHGYRIYDYFFAEWMKRY